MLTLKQKAVLDAVVVLIEEKGYTPTYEEIAAHLGLKSLSTVHKHLQILSSKGFVRITNKARSVEVLRKGLNDKGGRAK